MRETILKRGGMLWPYNLLEIFPILYQDSSHLYIEQLHQKNLPFMVWYWGLNCPMKLPLNSLCVATHNCHRRISWRKITWFPMQISFRACTELTWKNKARVYNQAQAFWTLNSWGHFKQNVGWQRRVGLIHEQNVCSNCQTNSTQVFGWFTQ